MSNDIAIRQPARGLTLADDQETFDTKQVAALQQIGVERASTGDLAVFFHVCKRTGLDPFARQIYMIERQGKQTIQTGIDGFRLVARRCVDRSGETLSIGASEWYDPSTRGWTDVWLSDEPPAAARVVVMRDGQPFPAVALWSEYRQTKRDGNLMAQWATRPAGMLAKCAEALALRKAFPQDLSGIYSDDEMARETHQAREVRRSRLREALADQQPTETPTQPHAAAEDVPEETVEGEVVDDAETGELLDPKSNLAKRMFVLFAENSLNEKEDRLGYCGDVAGREISSSKDLTVVEAQAIVEALAADLDAAQHGAQS